MTFLNRTQFAFVTLALSLSAAHASAANWSAITTTPGQIEGAKPARKVIFKQEGSLELSSSPENFGSDLESYLESNQGQALKENGISVLRIIQANKGMNLSSAQEQELKRLAGRHGLQLRLESVTIDEELRKRQAERAEEGATLEQLKQELIVEYQRQFEEIRAQGGDLDALYWESVKKLEDSLLQSFFSDSRSQGAISKSEQIKITERFRQNWADIYEPPSKIQWISGVSKGLVVGALTVAAWNKFGVSFDSVTFWLLTTKMLAVETVFGPYINVYLNFMSRKVEKAFGLAGVVSWGHIQGFTLFSIDKLVLHFYDPKNISGPWDPQYLLSYFSIGAIGGALGGLMPTGITRLMNKGYLSKFWGAQAMQTLDLLMPIEGALMSFGSPWLSLVFGLHQAVKFGTFVVGTALPTKGMLTLTPSELATDGAVTGVYQFDQMPSPEIAKSREALAGFLAAPNLSLQVKLEYLEYLKASAGQNKNLDEAVSVYLEFLEKSYFGKATYVEIQKLKTMHDDFTEDKINPLDHFKDRLNGVSSSLIVSNAKKQLRDQVNSLRDELAMHKKMAKILVKLTHEHGPELRELGDMPVPGKISLTHRVISHLESQLEPALGCESVF